MVDALSSYDSRQVGRMRAALEAWGAGRLGLRSLIDTLDGLLRAVAGLDTAWREAFRKEWGVLEVAYALASDMGSPVDTPENAVLIDKAVHRMQELLAALPPGVEGED